MYLHAKIGFEVPWFLEMRVVVHGSNTHLLVISYLSYLSEKLENSNYLM